MEIKHLHDWNVSTKEAVDIQKSWRHKSMTAALSKTHT